MSVHAPVGTIVGSAVGAVAGAGGRLHGCPVDAACPYCGWVVARPAEVPDWSFVDAVFCISLATRDDRMRHAAAQFHALGLCRHVVFYRPDPDPRSGVAGCWEAHRTVAALARAQGAARVLVFEDDVLFDRPVTPRRLRSVAAALDSLPAGWMLFYLGHWPLRVCPVGRHVVRTSSGCTHAYIASRRLLDWLVDRPWGSPGVAKHPLVGRGIDAAFALLPDAFAYVPMLAVQAPLASDTFGDERKRRPKKKRRLRHIVTHCRWREQALSRLMRPAATVVLLLSPLWCLLELVRPRLFRPPATGALSAPGPASRSAPPMPADTTDRDSAARHRARCPGTGGGTG